MASDIASPPPKLPAALVPMYIYFASSIIAFFSWLGGVRDAYRFDPFFRTEANIISLHFAFAGLVLVILGISFGSTSAALRRDIETGVAQTFSSNDQSIIVESVATAIAQGRTQKFLLTVVLIIGATFLFTFVIVRASLTPARNALASQKQFIGNIAHELRTPLSIIKTNAEVSLLNQIYHRSYGAV